MENTAYLVKPLVEKSEEYLKTSFELLKLRSIDKFTNLGSNLLSSLIVLLTFFLSLIFITVALALWLGDLLGKNYLGFLIVAAVYGIIVCFLLLSRESIKSKLTNHLIKQLLN